MLDRRGEILKTLRATPVVLRALVDGVDDARLRRRPAPGEWAIIEVVGHLADTEERALGRVRRMLAEDDPELEPFDQEALAEQRHYLELDLEEELARLEELRRQHLAELEALDGSGWARTRSPWRAWRAVGGAVRDPRGGRGGRPPGPDRQAAVTGRGRLQGTAGGTAGGAAQARLLSRCDQTMLIQMATTVAPAAPPASPEALPMELARALGDPLRWRIIELLAAEQLCVAHLAEELADRPAAGQPPPQGPA